MFPPPIRPEARGQRVAYALVVAAALLIWLLPLVGVGLIASKSQADLDRGNYWGLPTHPQLWTNLVAIFAAKPSDKHLLDSLTGQYLLNSLLVTLPVAVGAVALSTLSGYALARFRFRGNLWVLAIFMAGNFVPFQILMIPVRNLTVNVLHNYDTLWALIGFHTSFQLGFCTIFMRNFIRALPESLFEAAKIDGASALHTLVRIVVPLVRPAWAALFVLIFTFVWNDFFWSLVLVQSDAVRPITTALQSFQGMFRASWQLISTASLVAAAPPVLLFFLMQRHFVAGLTIGATKG